MSRRVGTALDRRDSRAQGRAGALRAGLRRAARVAAGAPRGRLDRPSSPRRSCSTTSPATRPILVAPTPSTTTSRRSPGRWAPRVAVAVALLLAWRRSRYIWVAAAIAVMLAGPRTHVTYATYLVVGLLGGPADHLMRGAGMIERAARLIAITAAVLGVIVLIGAALSSNVQPDADAYWHAALRLRDGAGALRWPARRRDRDLPIRAVVRLCVGAAHVPRTGWRLPRLAGDPRRIHPARRSGPCFAARALPR